MFWLSSKVKIMVPLNDKSHGCPHWWMSWLSSMMDFRAVHSGEYEGCSHWWKSRLYSTMNVLNGEHEVGLNDECHGYPLWYKGLLFSWLISWLSCRYAAIGNIGYYWLTGIELTAPALAPENIALPGFFLTISAAATSTERMEGVLAVTARQCRSGGAWILFQAEAAKSGGGTELFPLTWSSPPLWQRK
jgi:hypothetical protein